MGPHLLTASLLVLALGAAGAAQAADAPACPPQQIRWTEDCSGLAGRSLTGLDALRYISLPGEAYLTLGGEARVRIESLHNADFSLGGGPGYLETARRGLFSGDLHLGRTGPRLFGQLAVVEENGRRPGARGQDKDNLDLPQLFVDLPARIGPVSTTLRLGRQELNLSNNRLITTRDGVTVRRSFSGSSLFTDFGGGAVLSLVYLRPLTPYRDMFDDKPDRLERFSAVSLDLPHAKGQGTLTLFAFDRHRANARTIGMTGVERRYTGGARYARNDGAWDVYAQWAGQFGEVSGQPVRASGGAAGATRTFPGPRLPRLGINAAYASGDRRAGDGRVQTFDPIYPNNFGLSDAPLFYQTNYVSAGADATVRYAGRNDVGVAVFYVARQSTGDAIYSNNRPIAAAFNRDAPSAVLLQTSTRVPIGKRLEMQGSIVRAVALDGITGSGGKSATYVRVQATARF